MDSENQKKNKRDLWEQPVAKCVLDWRKNNQIVVSLHQNKNRQEIDIRKYALFGDNTDYRPTTYGVRVSVDFFRTFLQPAINGILGL